MNIRREHLKLMKRTQHTKEFKNCMNGCTKRKHILCCKAPRNSLSLYILLSSRIQHTRQSIPLIARSTGTEPWCWVCLVGQLLSSESL